MSKKYKLAPNIERVIIKPIQIGSVGQETKLLIPGQLKAGENLLCGEVIHAGGTRFKAGDVVYYSEYSAAVVVRVGRLHHGENISMTDLLKEALVVVAEDDIMSFEEEDDPRSVQSVSEKSKS